MFSKIVIFKNLFLFTISNSSSDKFLTSKNALRMKIWYFWFLLKNFNKKDAKIIILLGKIKMILLMRFYPQSCTCKIFVSIFTEPEIISKPWVTQEKLLIFILLNASHYRLKDRNIQMLNTDYTKFRIKTTSWIKVDIKFFLTLNIWNTLMKQPPFLLRSFFFYLEHAISTLNYNVCMNKIWCIFLLYILYMCVLEISLCVPYAAYIYSMCCEIIHWAWAKITEVVMAVLISISVNLSKVQRDIINFKN